MLTIHDGCPTTNNRCLGFFGLVYKKNENARDYYELLNRDYLSMVESGPRQDRTDIQRDEEPTGSQWETQNILLRRRLFIPWP